MSGLGVDVGVGVGGAGVGLGDVQDVRSRLRLKNEAKSLFIESFRLGNPTLFARPVRGIVRQC